MQLNPFVSPTCLKRKKIKKILRQLSRCSRALNIIVVRRQVYGNFSSFKKGLNNGAVTLDFSLRRTRRLFKSLGFLRTQGFNRISYLQPTLQLRCSEFQWLRGGASHVISSCVELLGDTVRLRGSADGAAKNWNIITTFHLNTDLGSLNQTFSQSLESQCRNQAMFSAATQILGEINF